MKVPMTFRSIGTSWCFCNGDKTSKVQNPLSPIKYSQVLLNLAQFGGLLYCVSLEATARYSK